MKTKPLVVFCWLQVIVAAVIVVFNFSSRTYMGEGNLGRRPEISLSDRVRLPSQVFPVLPEEFKRRELHAER